MTDTNQQLMEALDTRVEQRNDRRDFFKAALGAAAVAGAGAAAVSLGGLASAQTALVDTDYLNFILNIEYLQAQYYSYAVNGAGLAASRTGGATAAGASGPGTTIGGTQVSFTDPVVAAFASEFARDQIAHIDYLRSQLGAATVAMPAIDVGGTNPTGAFSKIARSAGLVGAGAAFNPYANDTNFLLGAFILEDVVVTAYKGLIPLIASPAYINAVFGLLATEAYQAGAIRTTLYAKGLQTQADALSGARDKLNSTTAAQDRDQGISASQGIPVTSGATIASNITPLDGNGLAYSRSAGQVLNILYLDPTSVSLGGFFPSGVNCAIRTSSTSATPAT